MSSKSRISGFIAVTLLVACMFMQIPLPSIAEKMRPDFITLILMYWWLAHPEKAGIIVGFLMGLVLDVMYGTLLGEHALGIVLIAWVFVKNYQRIRVQPIGQQAMVVFIALLVKQFIAFWIDRSRGYDTGSSLLYFSPALVGALLWPWLFVLLRDMRRKMSRG